MSLDRAPLVRRLQRMADRPGLVSRRPGRRLIERHERITAGLPLSALIGRHAGSDGPRAGADLPVVSATWTSAQPGVGAALPATKITHAPASGTVIQRKSAAAAPPSTVGLASTIVVPAAVRNADPGSLGAPPSTTLPPTPAAGPPAAAVPTWPATPGPASTRLPVTSPDPTRGADPPLAAESGPRVESAPGVDQGPVVEPPLVELAQPRLTPLPDLVVHRPARPDLPHPAGPSGPAPASSVPVVVRPTAPHRPRDGSDMRLSVVQVFLPSGARSGGGQSAPSAPSVVRAVGTPRHPATAPGKPGAPQLPVVPIAVAGMRATPSWRMLPLAVQAGSSAGPSAGERIDPATRTALGPAAGMHWSRPAGAGPRGPMPGSEVVAPPSPHTPPRPVDVEAIAATVQRRVLRRFELEAERRGGRR